MEKEGGANVIKKEGSRGEGGKKMNRMRKGSEKLRKNGEKVWKERKKSSKEGGKENVKKGNHTTCSVRSGILSRMIKLGSLGT